MRLLRKNEGYIYKLYYEGVLQYIGKTTDLQLRLRTHTKDKVFDRVEVAVVRIDDIECLEMSLIFELNPPLNKSKIVALAEKGNKVRAGIGEIVFVDTGFDGSYAEEAKKNIRSAAEKRETEEYVKRVLLETEPLIARMCVGNLLPKKSWITRETLEDIVRSNNINEFLFYVETSKSCLQEEHAVKFLDYINSEKLPSKYASYDN